MEAGLHIHCTFLAGVRAILIDYEANVTLWRVLNRDDEHLTIVIIFDIHACPVDLLRRPECNIRVTIDSNPCDSSRRHDTDADNDIDLFYPAHIQNRTITICRPRSVGEG